MRINKNIKILLCISLITSGLLAYDNSKYLTDKEKDEMYRIKTSSERFLEQHEKQMALNKKIEDKQKEIVSFMNSDEYILREDTRNWREPLGVSVSDITQVTFKTTSYSSLEEENGGYNVTCNGKPLEGNIVANNTLPQHSKILLGNEIYTVADRGSSRFNNSTRLDVLLEREYGESENEYKQRVSEYGVQYIKGYIIKKL